MDKPDDKYLKMSEELLPKKMSIYDPIKGASYSTRASGFNEALDLCIPIVAELLEKVDKSKNSQDYFNLAKQLTETMLEITKKDARIAFLEEALRKTIDSLDRNYGLITCVASNIAKTALEDKK